MYELGVILGCVCGFLWGLSAVWIVYDFRRQWPEIQKKDNPPVFVKWLFMGILLVAGPLIAGPDVWREYQKWRRKQKIRRLLGNVNNILEEAIAKAPPDKRDGIVRAAASVDQLGAAINEKLEKGDG